MPLKPEVNTSPYGALLIVTGTVAVILGLLVLPIGVALLFAAGWIAVVLIGIGALYYAGRRANRRLLGRSGGGR